MIDESAALDAATIKNIKMPNGDGFIPSFPNRL